MNKIVFIYFDKYFIEIGMKIVYIFSLYNFSLAFITIQSQKTKISTIDTFLTQDSQIHVNKNDNE